jgi:hypothetical protein
VYRNHSFEFNLSNAILINAAISYLASHSLA